MSPGCSLVFLALLALLSAATAVEVTVWNRAELVTCVGVEGQTCRIEAGVTLNLDQALSFVKNVTITGSGNSAIDLLGSIFLGSVSTGGGLTVVDLEIRNGYGATDAASCVYLAASGSFLNFTNVVLRDMYGVDGAAVRSYPSGTTGFVLGYMRNVTFLNVWTGVSAAGTALELNNPRDWILEDIRFLNCSGRGTATSLQPLFMRSYQNNLLNITFGGMIEFWAPEGYFPTRNSAALESASSSSTGSLTISSSLSRPSQWLLHGTTGSVQLGCVGSTTKFTAGSFTHLGAPGSTAVTTAYAIYGTGLSSIQIFILDTLTAQALGVLSMSVSTTLAVGGDLTSNDCPAPYAINALSADVVYTVSATNIRANNLKQGFVFNANGVTGTLIATNEIILSGDGVAANNAPAVYVTGGSLSLRASRNLVVRNMKKMSAVGAGVYNNGGVLQLEAQTITFSENSITSQVAGGLYLSANSVTTIKASQYVRFEANLALNGSAIYVADNTAVLSLGGSTAPFYFINNRATQGAALNIPLSMAPLFENATFVGNLGGRTCGAVTFINNECVRFNTSGIWSGNGQSSATTPAVCEANQYLCESVGTSCKAAQPSVGTWVCQNGQWISIGPVTGGSLVVPPVSVVINGNLNLTGTTVFAGLESSLTIEGGCAYIDGELVVQLTPEELEAIAKESGSTRNTVLITQYAQCSSNLATLVLTASKGSKSCRKVNVTTQDNVDGDRSSLVAIFKVDSSDCNTKWIILGSVLGGVVLIAAILALVFTCNSKARHLVRPYSKRNNESAGQVS